MNRSVTAFSFACAWAIVAGVFYGCGFYASSFAAGLAAFMLLVATGVASGEDRP